MIDLRIVVHPLQHTEGMCSVMLLSDEHALETKSMSRQQAIVFARDLAEKIGLVEIPRGPDQSDDYSVHFKE